MKPITVTVNKAKSESSGLSLFKDGENRIIINGIIGGPFKDTGLQSSMQIISINGRRCEGMDEGTAVSILDGSSGRVTVVAQEVIYSAVVIDESGPSSSMPYPSAPVDPYGTHVAASTTTTTSNPPPTAPNHLQQPPVQVQQTTVVLPSDTVGNQPQGCEAGGRWAIVRYNGQKTWILCLVLAFCFNIYSGCGTCAFLCPQDRMNVYVVNGKVYDRSGKYLGRSSQFRFL